MNNLNHKYNEKEWFVLTEQLDGLISKLDQKHRIQRKIQFLLDIRWYFAINKIKWSYVEFGLYRWEMLYSAYKVLNKLNLFTKYVGFDTFEWEPIKTKEDANKAKYITEWNYLWTIEKVNSFLWTYINSNDYVLIKWDFRQEKLLQQQNKYNPISLSVIDCNLVSSIETSLDYTLKHIIKWWVIFFDDYFVNMQDGICHSKQLLSKYSKKYWFDVLDFNTYAPCAKAFILTKK